MAANSEHLAAARAVVATFARTVMDNQLDLPGEAVDPSELPDAVAVARAFYVSRLTPEDDSFGFVLVHQLPADAGSAFLVIGYNVEASWGAAEIYSAEGEWWTSGAFHAAVVGYHELDTVRAAMMHLEPVENLIPPVESLTWIPQGPTFMSAGGRFVVCPADGSGRPGRFALLDRFVDTGHDFATAEGAQAHAAALHAQS